MINHVLKKKPQTASFQQVFRRKRPHRVTMTMAMTTMMSMAVAGFGSTTTTIVRGFSQPRLGRHRLLKNQGRYRRIETLRQQEQESLSSNEARELYHLLEKGDPYDASLFDDDHCRFKQQHNQAFCDLTRWLLVDDTTGPLVYLDGANGATTRALLSAGVSPKQLFVANEWADTVQTLVDDPFLRDIHVHLGKLQDMDSVHPLAIVGAYLDGCGGMTQPILDMVDNILKGRVAPKMVLGFTLTNAEPKGRALIDRIQDVTRYINRVGRSVGYDHMYHVGDDPSRFGVDPNLPRQHVTTATTWLVLKRD